jgi:hypothetical protein
VKHADLIRHLEAHGCRLVREGGRYSIYMNLRTGQGAPVPRHREVKDPLAWRICKQLGVPVPIR